MRSTADLEWAATRHAIVGADPEVALYGEVSVWFHKLDLFRRGEQARLYDGEPTAEDLEIHKGLACRLIADGEHLIRLIQEAGGLLSNHENIKGEDLGAALDALRDTYRGWHEAMPKDARERILGEIFRDVA